SSFWPFNLLTAVPSDHGANRFFIDVRREPAGGTVCHHHVESFLDEKAAELRQRPIGRIRQVLGLGPKNRFGCLNNEKRFAHSIRGIYFLDGKKARCRAGVKNSTAASKDLIVGG